MHSFSIKQLLEKTIAIESIIANHFNKNFLISLKNQYYQGHEYFNKDDFKFSQSHSAFLKSKTQIIIRFLCELKTLHKACDDSIFFQNFNTHSTSPIFLLIPYFFKNIAPAKENLVAYTPQCEFQLIYNIETHETIFKSYNYLSCDSFSKIQKKINDTLYSKKSLYKEYKIFSKCSDLRTIKKDILNSKNQILMSINRTKKHMINGDLYLANITKVFQTPSVLPHFEAQYFLSRWFTQRPQFGFLLRQNDIALACYSPERFLLKKNNKLATEPIKGTAPLHLQNILWNDSKEIFEHTMAVDLLRNDLNTICIPGSVKVEKPFYLKKCNTILQMQTSITGTLNCGITFRNIMDSMLPAGSISGTPKKRTCEIINTYESGPRGYYTGIAGIIERNGDFDFAVLIRSCFKGKLGAYIGVGAGITTLSDPEKEFEEFCLKLRTFL